MEERLKLTCEIGDWPSSPTKGNSFGVGGSTGNAFSWNTPQSLAQRRPQTNQQEDTPQTDNPADTPGVSEQESPAAPLQPKAKRNKLADLTKLKLRRRRQKMLRDHELYSESEDDEESSHQRAGKSLSASSAGVTPSWTMEDHRDLPYIASGYLQLGFNLFVLGVVLYFVVVFIQTIQADVNKKVEEYSAEILAEISQCSKEYLENRCSPDQRVPAMQLACQAWERCMERDPGTIGRARVSAETFAEIVNSFIEPISYKTMAFCALLLFGSLGISNAAFGLVRQHSRARHEQIHQQQLQHQQQQLQQHERFPTQATFMIQATPQRRRRGS
ncbi:hypothetical protein PYCC9005_004292 [Savitreella phatthalungensis]